MLVRGSEVGVVERGYLKVERGRFGHPSAHALFVVELHLLGGTEEGHIAAESAATGISLGLMNSDSPLSAKWIWKYAARGLLDPVGEEPHRRGAAQGVPRLFASRRTPWLRRGSPMTPGGSRR